MDFYEFSKYLYAYHKGDKIALRPLYKDILKAIYYWYGNSRRVDNGINVKIGRKQLNFKITQEVELKPLIKLFHKNELSEIIYEFTTNIPIGFKTKNEKQIEFNLDIKLYILLRNILNGYSSNKLDKENNIDFERMIHSIASDCGLNSPIYFENIINLEKDLFVLSYDPELGYEFEKK